MTGSVHRADDPRMRTFGRPLLALGVMSVLMLSACGSGKAGPSPSPVIDGDGPGGQPGGGGVGNQPGESSAAGGVGGPGAGGQPGAGGTGGGGGNTVTRTWSETVSNPLGVVHQDYQAIVNVVFGPGEDGSWTLAGTANITSTFSNEVTEQLQDITGAACTTHHTDDSSASGSVDVDGGIEAREGFYQF